ncbi:MAG: AAA family ATPase [Gammaproteobacteria bacterium]|nr:AAA family ATPase [Gammaproteobacteria bacterium]
MESSPDSSVAVGGNASELFGTDTNPQSLYLNPTLQQRLDLIEHLIEFGRQIILISGVAGSGKSAVLGRFATGQRSTWYCIRVQGGPSLTAHALYTQVAHELDIDPPADASAAPDETLRKRVMALERAGKIPVLLLDDADQLLPEAIAAVIRLAHAEDQLAEMRVLMTADLSESTLLEGLQREHPQHGLVHVVEMPRLTEAQIRALIAHQLTAAGLTTQDYFSRDDIVGILANSDGVTGKVITLARQHLAGRPAPIAKQRSTTRSGGASSWSRTLGIGALAALALGLGAWWASRTVPTGPQRVETVSVAPPVAEIPPSAVEPSSPPVAETAVPSAVPVREAKPEAVVVPAPLPIEPVLEPKTSVPVAVPSPTQTMRSESAPLAPKVAHDTTHSKPKLPSMAATGKPKRTPEKFTTSRAKSSNPGAHPGSTARAGDWLTQPAAVGYTLQLFGVRERGAAQRFIAQHGIGTKSEIITSTLKGAPWYIVVYGHYLDRAAALDAGRKLASRLPHTQPWARSIGSVRSLPP